MIKLKSRLLLMLLVFISCIGCTMSPLHLSNQTGKIEVFEVKAAKNGWIKSGSNWYYYENDKLTTGWTKLSGI